MIHAWLLVASLVPTAIGGAEPAQKPVTLSELVARAMTEGKESPVADTLAEAMNLGTAKVPKRKLRYSQSTCPDKREHTFGVLYRDLDGKPKPTSVMITIATSQEVDGKTMMDSTIYLATVEGSLKSAFRKHGPIEDVTVDPVVIGPPVRKKFKSELNFFLKLVPALGLRADP